MYLVMGIFCAAVGVLFTRTLYRVEDLFDDIKFPDYLKGIFGGLILGVGALAFPQILGVGYGAIDMALAQQMAWWLRLQAPATQLARNTLPSLVALWLVQQWGAVLPLEASIVPSWLNARL